MSKIAITLLFFGTVALFWEQTEAKPFLFLPVNFFVLTTREPATVSKSYSTSSSSYSTSLSSTENFQLPTAIISKKLSFLTSLLSAFGGAGVGGFAYGDKFNTATTTSRPKTTTEPDSIFTPESSTSTKATTTSTEKSVITTTTTTTEESTTAEATTSSSDTIDIENDSTTTTIVGDKDETQKAETVGVTSGYDYQQTKGSVGGSHSDNENEILSSNVSNKYLPPR